MRLPVLGLFVVTCFSCAPSADPESAHPDASIVAARADEPGDSWQAAVGARMRDAGHAFRQRGDRWEARSEAGIGGEFDAAGVSLRLAGETVHVRSAIGGSSEPHLGACVAGKVDPLGQCVRRLERTEGVVTEWWTADERGLEQGWLVGEGPDSGAIRLDQVVDGASVEVSEETVWLQGDEGGLVLVSALFATDDDGDVLPSRFEEIDGGFSVVVDVTGASWPVRIDPLYTTVGTLITGEPGNATLGWRLDGVGDVNGDGYDDVVVSGVYRPIGDGTSDEFAGFLYLGSASGLSTTATVQMLDGHSYTSGFFGFNISGAGDIDADGYDDVVVGYNYTAAVFYGSSAGLANVPDADITASSSYSGLIAIAGVGDLNNDGYADVVAQASSSSVYVYKGSASGLATTGTTVTSVGSSNMNIVGVGDVNKDGYPDVAIGSGSSSSSGTVKIYRGSSSGLATTAMVTLTGPATGSYFGQAIAGGDVDKDGYSDVAVGAYGYSSNKGRVALYRGAAAGPSTTASATIDGTVASADFGYSVSAADLDGDGYGDILVGAPSAGDGSAYVFSGKSSGLSTTASTTLTGLTSSEKFGRRVSFLGDVNGDSREDLAVSATSWGGGSGAVYIFEGSASGPTLGATIEGVMYDHLGDAVASAGDVDGDGYEDVIAGGYFANAQKGGAWLFRGSSSGLSTTASTSLTGPSTYSRFGASVAGLGDIDGDGYDDVAVGAYSAATVFVYRGSASGLSSSPAVTLTGGTDFGYAVAGLGDVNGDGYPELGVVTDTTGTMYVYEGSAAGLATTASTTATIAGSRTLASIGDVNSDGYDDVGLGCYGYLCSSGTNGVLYVFAGSATGLPTTATATIASPSGTSEQFGRKVAAAGDVNADGYGDLVVGAPSYYPDGRAYVFLGSASGLATTPSTTLSGATTASDFGMSVEGMGDLDGDGYDEIAVAYQENGPYGTKHTGTVVIYAGSSAGTSTTASTTITAFEYSAYSDYGGSGISGTGDLDGDGTNDLVVGASAYSDYGGAVAVYYGYVDRDGDGYLSTEDCDDTDPLVHAKSTYYADADGDGYGKSGSTTTACSAPSGYSSSSTDCDDTSASIRPGAAEVCDSKDQDCDGSVDEGAGSTWYRDADGDGYGKFTSTTTSCSAPTGYVSDATDCDDASSGVYPGATESCDGADNDCDGSLDEGLTTTYYADADGDGYGSATSTLEACTLPAGYATNSTDCDDTRSGVRPGAAESCNLLDDDCDGTVDEGVKSTYYLDADGDGYGVASTTTTGCSVPTGYSAASTDCDDTAASISPAGTETCNGSDDDCDGSVDESGAADAPLWYADADGDGYGNASASTRACTAPAGSVSDGTDCDDTDATVLPGGTETCDGEDDDCDAVVDESDAVDASTFYGDADGDGFGDPATTRKACSAPAGFTSDATDCDDRDAGVSPSATERCDGVDNDCDGTTDGADAVDASTWHPDVDGDGYGSETVSTRACSAPSGSIADDSDCDDTRATVSPDGVETCDGLDEDCNGTVDDGFSGSTFYADGDGDGYGDASSTIDACEAPPGYVSDDTDCDDGNAEAWPGAEEIWYDGEDQACDGGSDYDADGDGQDSATYDGDDCDDTDPDVYAGAPDDPYDGQVTDCSGSVTEFDVDGDGALSEEGGGGDCDDARSDVYPGAEEIWYDGVDQDCDGNDADQDGDGAGYLGDCDDTDPTVISDCSEDDKGCGGCSTSDAAGLGPVAALVAMAAILRRRRAAGGLAVLGALMLGACSPEPLSAPEAEVAGVRSGHGVLAEVDGRVVRVRGEGGEPLWSAEVVVWGREGALVPGGAIGLRQDEDRMELDHGGLVEWWHGRPDGFEQGFDVAVRPAGDGPLVVDVGLDGEVGPEGGSLVDAAGRAWLIGSVRAWDADGAGLDVALTGTAEGFRLTVDDGPARYPIVIDPTYTSASWEIGGGYYLLRYSSLVGADVDGDGYDDLIVAEPNWASTGRVVVYPGVAGSALTEGEPSQVIEGSALNAYFGLGLADAGDVDGDGYDDVLIGAAGAGTGGEAYLYKGSASGLASAPSTTWTSPSSGANFGYALAAVGDLDGDGYGDYVIGGPAYSSTGRAWYYKGTASGPSTTVTFTIAGSGTRFGSSIVAAGDVNGDGFADVAIGACCATYYAGTVQVYHGAATGFPTSATTSLPGSSGSSWTGFGSSVAAAGDVNGDGYDDLIVGAPSMGSSYSDGRAFVYHGAKTGISTTVATTIYAVTSGIYTGTDVAGVGDVDGDGYDDVAVGSWSGSSVGTTSAYVFPGSSSGVTTFSPVTVSGTDGFGGVLGAGDFNADGHADLAVVADATYTNKSGSITTFAGAASGMSSTEARTIEPGPYVVNGFTQVAALGDVNGDGHDDFGLGTSTWGSSKGVIYVFDGTSSVAAGVPDQRIEATSTSSYYGQALAGVGDVNGDGYDDVVTAGSSANRAELFLGTASGLSSASSTTFSATKAGMGLGAGDLDGDGYDDVVLGAQSGGTGRAYLYRGSSSGVSSTAWITLGSASSTAYYGSAIAVGDFDADGYDDVAVGAYDYSTNRGQVTVHMGSSSGPSTTATRTLSGEGTSNYFGYQLVADDMDGDGDDDLVVSAYGYGSSKGRIYQFDGGPSGIGAAPDVTIDGTCQLGKDMRAAGDLDGDTYGDLLVFWPYGSSCASAGYGMLNIHPGSATGVSSTATATLSGSGTTTAGWLFSVGRAGDVDADGVEDLLVVSSSYVRLYRGSATDSDGDGSPDAVDCDDARATVYPGAPELCDGVDNDCDGTTDETSTFYADADGDGYGDATKTTSSCGPPSGYVATSTDCDDTNASISPVGTETCNGNDDDCDGTADEGVSTTYYVDADGDGYGGTSTKAACSTPSGYVSTSGDCNDSASGTHPGATETCDSADQDCDGTVDEGVTSTYYRDADGDGYGTSSTTTAACSAPTGYVSNSTDCNDTTSAAYPGATEICDSIDDDCDGSVDEGVTSTFYRDADGDGYGVSTTTTTGCSAPSGYAATSTDCDDTRATVNPGASETCDSRDNDCDGSVDEGVTSTYYLDADADGYGVTTTTTTGCSVPSGYAATSGDCDDTSSAVSPGASEICDGKDNDCDGLTDESGATDATTWYLDGDADGYGGTTSVKSCSKPTGYVSAGSDCDDTDAAVHPGVTETCDGVDQDCDGSVDEDAAATAEVCDGLDNDCDGTVDDGFSTTAFFADGDDDGFGDADRSLDACAAPPGYVADDTDCDDTAADVFPGATEVWYDGIDEDCDGGSDYDADGDAQDSATYGGEDCDDADPDVYAGAPDDPYDGKVSDCSGETVEYDADGDGSLDPRGGGDDCDDARSDVHPGAVEVWYDGADQDCDGNDDDQDEDGAPKADDCDDTNPNVHPAATEIWYDGVDQDCDGNDVDRDGDGAAYAGDCDDNDPDVITCEDEPKCGCATPGGAGALPMLLPVVLLLARRRRRD